MTRLIAPNFFFDETSADEDMMAEMDAEKAKAELDPDALWAAQCAHNDTYDGPGSEDAAIAAAINAYLAGIRPDYEEFMNKLAAFKVELESLSRELKEIVS